MVRFERVQRPFWMHQIVEYILGLALIMTAVQQPDPTIPALMGLLVLVNAAVAVGPAGAFRVVSRRWHRRTDLMVIAALFGMAIQPWWDIDATGRVVLFAIGIVMLFIWFHTDYTERVARSGPGSGSAADSEQIGRTAGRAVGQGVNSLKRWKDSFGSE